MKRIPKLLTTAAMLAAFTVGAGPANAELKGFSPNGSYDGTPSTLAAGALPTWFQGQNGVAVGPCLTDLVNCGLLAGGTFDGFTMPLVFPTNYPDEGFYFMAVTNPAPIVGSVPVITASIEAALEFVTFDPITGILGIPTANSATGVFHRLRVAVEPLTVPGATGLWTVDHPWGSTTFDAADCKKQGTGCQITIDIPQALSLNNWVPSLGIPPLVLPANAFTMDTFLKSTIAPAGFLGNSATAAPFTGGSVRNFFKVTGPPGATADIPLAIITGKTIGLEVAPVGVQDFTTWMLGATSTPMTFTVTNLTGVDIPPRDQLTGAGLNPTFSNPVFTLEPGITDTCGTDGLRPIAPGDTCTFNVIFKPVENVVSNGTITLTSSASPPITVAVSGNGDGIAPSVAITTISNFSKLATQTISGTVSDNITVGGVNVSVDGGAAVPATVNATAGTWTFNVPALALDAAHTIAVTANDTALAAPGNITTVNDSITVDTILPAVAVTAPATGLLTNIATQALVSTATDANLASTVAIVDGGTPTAVIPANLGPFTDGPHTVAIMATDAAGNVTTVQNNFTVDTTPPAITVTSPNIVNARLGQTNPALTVTVNDTNPPAIANTVVTLDNVVVPAGTASIGPFTVGSVHTLIINTTDGAGNPTTTTLPFTIILSDGRIVSLGAAPVGIADALAALRHTVQLATLTGDAFAHGDVAPLDANGIPNPNGTIDISDALVILRKVVGLITTF